MADAFQLMSHPFVPLDDLVELVGDFPADARPVQWKTDRKVTFLQGDQRREQEFGIEGSIGTMLKARNGFLPCNDETGFIFFHVLMTVRRQLPHESNCQKVFSKGAIRSCPHGPVQVWPGHNIRKRDSSSSTSSARLRTDRQGPRRRRRAHRPPCK